MPRHLDRPVTVAGVCLEPGNRLMTRAVRQQPDVAHGVLELGKMAKNITTCSARDLCIQESKNRVQRDVRPGDSMHASKARRHARITIKDCSQGTSFGGERSASRSHNKPMIFLICLRPTLRPDSTCSGLGLIVQEIVLAPDTPTAQTAAEGKLDSREARGLLRMEEASSVSTRSTRPCAQAS